MTQNLKKVVLTSGIGNALEFYDFTICGVFLATLSNIYFPSSNPTLSLFASFFAFSAAFWTRPFGAYVFGYIGDQLGRKKALTISVSLMGLPTFFIGILPGYEVLGIAAPLLLILCRMVQGLCTGGEYNGAAIFALEHAAEKQPGFISGLISASCVLGAIIATFAGALVSLSSMPSWAWRVPFLLGVLISFVGYFIRKSCTESPEFVSSSRSVCTQPLLAVFREAKAPFLMSMIAGGMNGLLSYTLFAFLNVYLSRYVQVPLAKGLFLNFFGLASFMIFCPFFGALSDKLTPRRSIFLSLLLVFTVSFSTFFLLQSSEGWVLLLGQLLLGMLVASFVGPCHAFMQTLFPARIRYTGVSMSFCLGMALTGGTTPMLLTYLIDLTHNLYMPALMLMFYSAFMGLGLVWAGSWSEKSKNQAERIRKQAA